MRIATLQFAPKLGDVDGNIQKANDLLQNGKVLSLDGKTKLPFGVEVGLLRPELLVLPEMALTGTYTTTHILFQKILFSTCFLTEGAVGANLSTRV